MNGTDLMIVTVVLVSGVFAFFRGFVHELLAVISWIGAAVATLYAFPYAQPEARKLISVPLLADMAAGVAIFLILLIILSILTRMLCRRIRDSSLGPLDRSLGLVFGLLRGAVLICIAWLLLIWLLPREDHPEWITEARSLPLVERGGAMLVTLIPERLRKKGGEALGGVKSKTERLRETEQRFQSLLAPAPKGGASRDEPGYNSRMRDEMRRAIEGISGAEERAE